MRRRLCLLVLTLTLVSALSACEGSDGESGVSDTTSDDVTSPDIDRADGGPSGQRDVGEAPLPDTEAPADAVPDTPPGDAEDVTPAEPDAPDVAEEPDTHDTVDAPDADPPTGCTSDEQCEAELAPGPCEVARCDRDTGRCLSETIPPPECCRVDADCDDGDPLTDGSCCPEPGGYCASCPQQCTDDQWCEERAGLLFPETEFHACHSIYCDVLTGACVLEDLRDDPERCCLTHLDCDDGNDATQDFCMENNRCCGGPCCVGPCDGHDDDIVSLHATFDDGWDDFSVTGDLDPTDGVGWHLLAGDVYHGGALYLGDPATGCYFNGPDVDADCETPYHPLEDPAYGGRVSVTLQSREIRLPEDQEVALTFWLQGQSEPPPPGAPFVPDNLRFYVEDVSELEHPTLVFETATYGNHLSEPTLLAADLSRLADRVVRLRIEFDTMTADLNRYPGWWLDEVTIFTSCGRGCETDFDCADSNACTRDVCTPLENAGGGICARTYEDPTCVPCLDDSGCADDDPCTVDVCDDLVCAHRLDPAPQCCDEIEVAAWDFADGSLPAEWTVEDDGSDVRWQVMVDRESGETALYFGDAATMSYDSGARAFGRVTAGPFDLPSGEEEPVVALAATWDLLLHTEYDDYAEFPQAPPDALTDLLELFVVREGVDGAWTEELVWTSGAPEVGGTTRGEWRPVTALLDRFRGETVWFTFQFDTGDEHANTFGGVWIDNLRFGSICGDVCASDAECDDGNPCTVDICDTAACRNPLRYEGCCVTADDCLAENACTTTQCMNERCVYTDDGDPQTCCSGTVWSTSFEDGELVGFEVELDAGGDPAPAVFWQASELCAHDGALGLYFGDPITESYATPYAVSGAITTPPFGVPTSGEGAVWARFDLYLDTEWNGVTREGWESPPALVRDALTLYAVVAGTAVPVWDAFGVDHRGSTCGLHECGWQEVLVDLSPYRGYTVQLQFRFDSVDDLNNDGRGVCIDGLELVSGCAHGDIVPPACFRSEDCGDDDPCTDDACLDGACDHLPSPDPGCCVATEVAGWDWDDGTSQGWFFQPDPIYTDVDVAWQVAQVLALPGTGGALSHSGLYALYFGDPETGTYAAGGEAVAGTATSPPITLPAARQVGLHLAYIADIVPGETSTPPRDLFEIRVTDNATGQSSPVLTTRELLVADGELTWQLFSADLTAFADTSVTIDLEFASGDGEDNDGLGILVDSMWLEAEVCPD